MSHDPHPKPFIDGGDVYKWTRTLFFVIIAVASLSIISNYLQLDLLWRAAEGSISPDEADSNDKRQQLIVYVHIVVFIATATSFLIWTYRVYSNLKPLGAGSLRYSAGWAVGAFFVPILNIMRPYQIFDEIWKASDPDAKDGLSWRSLSTSPYVYQWWAAFILTTIVQRLLSKWAAGETIDALVKQTWAAIAINGFEVLAAILALRLMDNIDFRQRMKFENMAVSSKIMN